MDERTRDMTNALYLLITGSLPVPEYPGVMMADLIETHDACVRAEAKAEALREAAPDYDHYWQIVLHWAKDDGQAIKRLSVLQMRTLCERLESITRHAILADQAPEAEKVEGPQDGAEMIRRERDRQLSEEGWTPEHDDKHVNGEMAQAAACYATPPKPGCWISSYRGLENWPDTWDGRWWKPCPDNRIRELVKAGALVAAEIDRLMRRAEVERRIQEER